MHDNFIQIHIRVSSLRDVDHTYTGCLNEIVVHPVNHPHLTFLTFMGFPLLMAGFGFEGKD